MNWTLDKTLGYVYALDQECPYANSQGKVYQHIFVMCSHIQRRLTQDECVHHIDRDKSNNALSNLMLLTFSEHAKLHAIEDRGYTSRQITCPTCAKAIIVSSKSAQIYCSSACAAAEQRNFEISKDDLSALVWALPTTKVAKILGVSDVAVSKRCKKLGIRKPPRGYWAKVQHGIAPKFLQEPLP